jgi:hypothetical protein
MSAIRTNLAITNLAQLFLFNLHTHAFPIGLNVVAPILNLSSSVSKGIPKSNTFAFEVANEEL